jgi:hypothetical protein
MIARILGSICLFGLALPVAMHLAFSVFEMWSFAILAGTAGYLLSYAQKPVYGPTAQNISRDDR